MWEDLYNSLACKLCIFHAKRANVILTLYEWDTPYLFLLKLSRDAFRFFITLKELNGSNKSQLSLLSRQIKQALINAWIHSPACTYFNKKKFTFLKWSLIVYLSHNYNCYCSKKGGCWYFILIWNFCLTWRDSVNNI